MPTSRRLLRSLQTPLALAGGVALGAFLGKTPAPGLLAQAAERICQMAAQLSLAWLSALAVPLIVSSAVLGGVGLEAMRGMGRLAGKSLAWMFGSTLLAVGLGVSVIALARPGFFLLEPWSGSADSQRLPEPGEWHPFWVGLTLLALSLGFYRNQLEEGHGKLVMRFCQALDGMLAPLLRWTQRFADLGVFFLAVAATATGARQNADVSPNVPLSSVIGWDVLLVLLAALAFVGLVSGLLWWLARANVWRCAGFLLPAMGVAAAGQTLPGALPLTMDGVRRHLGVSQRVASVTLPLGAAFHRDGCALAWTMVALYLWGPQNGEVGEVSLSYVLLSGLFVGFGLGALSNGLGLFLPLLMRSLYMQHQAMPSLLLLVIVGAVGSAISVFSQVCITILVARSEGEYWVPGPPPDPDELQGLKSDLERAGY